MPRVARIAPGGVIFHVLNRGNARRQVFEHDGDYEALERVIVETAERIAIRLLALLYHAEPLTHGVVADTRRRQRLTTFTFAARHLYRQTVGTGHLCKVRTSLFLYRMTIIF